MFSEKFLASLNAYARVFCEEAAADYEVGKDDPRWKAERMQPGWAPVMVPGAKKCHAGKPVDGIVGQGEDGLWRILCRSPKKTIPAPPADTTDDTWRVTCVMCRAKLGIRSMHG